MLPQVLPMLAVPATPFDSPEYSFEIKWNGIRALAAVEAAGQLAMPGDVVLLSPACASFDMFDSFEHRGDVFKKLVERLE